MLEADFDDNWLRYQGRHAEAKNCTDGVEGAPPVVPFSYLVGLIDPIYASMRPFLEAGATSGTHVQRMSEAWLKAVTLWSEPSIQRDRL